MGLSTAAYAARLLHVAPSVEVAYDAICVGFAGSISKS